VTRSSAGWSSIPPAAIFGSVGARNLLAQLPLSSDQAIPPGEVLGRERTGRRLDVSLAHQRRCDLGRGNRRADRRLGSGRPVKERIAIDRAALEESPVAARIAA
jgi:hypothetical protein